MPRISSRFMAIYPHHVPCCPCYIPGIPPFLLDKKIVQTAEIHLFGPSCGFRNFHGSQKLQDSRIRFNLPGDQQFKQCRCQKHVVSLWWLLCSAIFWRIACVRWKTASYWCSSSSDMDGSPAWTSAIHAPSNPLLNLECLFLDMSLPWVCEFGQPFAMFMFELQFVPGWLMAFNACMFHEISACNWWCWSRTYESVWKRETLLMWINFLTSETHLSPKNLDEQSVPDRFWKLGWSESAHGCGAKQILKTACSSFLEHFWKLSWSKSVCVVARSGFPGQNVKTPHTLGTWDGKIAKYIGANMRQLSHRVFSPRFIFKGSLAELPRFWCWQLRIFEDVSQNCCVFDVVNVEFLRTPCRLASFSMVFVNFSCLKEVSHNCSLIDR